MERSVDGSGHEMPWGLAKQNLLGELSTVLVELRGSLALTGIGHGTNKVAVAMSLWFSMSLTEKSIGFFIAAQCFSRHSCFEGSELRQACVLGLHGVTPAEVDPAQASGKS